MQVRVALPGSIIYVRGWINGAAVTFEQPIPGQGWVATVDQSTDNWYDFNLELADEAGNVSTYTDRIYYVPPYFIYDRTQEDINNHTAKAYINAADLNRVESNTDLIAGYIGIPVLVKKDWIIGDLPRISDYKRIRDNVELVRKGYAIKEDTPRTPKQPLNTWQKWNAIERILHDVFFLYIENQNNMYYCGDMYAGEGDYLL